MDDETTGRLPDDDTELTRVTPPDQPTQAMPPAGEGETQVMPDADADATRVMPAAGAGKPAAGGSQPPPPTQPTLLMTRGRSSDGGGGVPWWVWLIVVLAVVAAAAALWFFYLRPQDTTTTTTAGDVFIGNWSPEAGTGGGLVIKQAGDQFKVTQYDPQLQQVGSTNADLVGEDLQVSVKASALGLTGITGSVNGTLTHDSANDTLTLQFSSGSLTMEPIVYVRVDVLLPASASPTPSPTASPSPTLSPSPTASPSPSTSASPTADQQVVAAIAKLQVGIVAWAADNNNLYPPPQDVVEGGGISQYVDPWPTNAFTGQPMTPGTGPGSYVYEQLSGGQAYKLTGYLSNGLTYSVP